MLNIPGTLLQGLGRLQIEHPWVVLLHFDLGHGRHLRLAHNTESLTFDGEVYEASAFEAETIRVSKSSRMPTYTIRVRNLDDRLSGWLRQPGGLEGRPLTVTLVNVEVLADFSEFETTYDIRGHGDDEEWIEFELGGPNLYRSRFPRRRYSPLCEVPGGFKGSLCGYAGAETECDRSLTRCRELSNATRFGGTPGQRPNSIKVVA